MEELMELLTVGQKFPFPCMSYDALVPYVDGTTLSFVITLRNPTKKEIAGINKGLARYGVASIDDIPFIVWDFAQANISFDCCINILREPPEKQNAFFPEVGNLLTIYLVDWSTGILHGIRSIGAELKFMDEVKTTTLQQIARYNSVTEVDTAVQRILSTHQTPDLMHKAKMYTARGTKNDF
jgi:hypothetical protein